jgi:hypothetical protein
MSAANIAATCSSLDRDTFLVERPQPINATRSLQERLQPRCFPARPTSTAMRSWRAVFRLIGGHAPPDFTGDCLGNHAVTNCPFRDLPI